VKKYFLIITTAERAWLGLLAASIGGLVSAWTPLPVTIALLTLVLPVGVFLLAYLGVYSFWLLTTTYLPTFTGRLRAATTPFFNRVVGS
jgi:hypothetical protein